MALIQLGSIEEAVGSLMVSVFKKWQNFFISYIALAQYEIERDESLARFLLTDTAHPAAKSSITAITARDSCFTFNRSVKLNSDFFFLYSVYDPQTKHTHATNTHLNTQTYYLQAVRISLYDCTGSSRHSLAAPSYTLSYLNLIPLFDDDANTPPTQCVQLQQQKLTL